MEMFSNNSKEDRDIVFSLSRQEAVRLIQDLANQLAGQGGSCAYFGINHTDPKLNARYHFMVRE